MEIKKALRKKIIHVILILSQSPLSHQDPGLRQSIEEHQSWLKQPGGSHHQINPWPVLILAQSTPSLQDPGLRTSVVAIQFELTNCSDLELP